MGHHIASRVSLLITKKETENFSWYNNGTLPKDHTRVTTLKRPKMIPYLRIETKKTIPYRTAHTVSLPSPPPKLHPRKGFVLTQAYKVLSIERRRRYWWHDSSLGSNNLQWTYYSNENYKFTFRCINSGELGAAIIWQQEAFWRICEKSARE